MKKTITMLMSAAALTTANAELTINENLSLQGFIDMSAAYFDGEVGGVDTSDNKFSLDQVEIDFLFNYDKVTGRVDVQAVGLDTDGNGNSELEVEQAFASYALNDAVSFTAGRYQSGLGLEGVEPTELYQFSGAYTSFLTGFAMDPYPTYNQGVKVDYVSDATQFYISLQDSAFGIGDNRIGGAGASNWGIETGVSFTPNESLKFFLGGAYEDFDTFGGSGDDWVVNGYVSHTSGSLTLGAEIYYGEYDSIGGDGFWAMIMANYGFTEQFGLTGRVSYMDIETLGVGQDGIKFTVSPSYAWTDNLLTVFEVSYVDFENDDEISFVVEQLFSF